MKKTLYYLTIIALLLASCNPLEDIENELEDMDKGFEANFGPRVEVLVVVNNDHRTALKVWNLASANPTAEYFGKLRVHFLNHFDCFEHR